MTRTDHDAVGTPEHPSLMPQLTPEAELAVLARVLFREGYDDHDTGHITYRQQGDVFLTLPFELGWDEVRASDIVTINGEGEKLAGKWSYTPSLQLHIEFHHARPSSQVTIHQHPQYGTVYAMAGRIPPAFDQRGVAIDDDQIAFYDDYTGAVDDRSAAARAVEAIGDANYALLQNHGVFVVADDIEQAYSRASALEWRCRQAWMVESIGGGRQVPELGRRDIIERAATGDGIELLWAWAVRREIREDPGVLS